MDITLALVTVLSLALAATMSVVAWRLVRDERQHAEARTAGRAAAAGDDDEGGESPARPTDAWTSVPARRSRQAVAVALAVFVAGSAASLTVVFGEARRLDRRGGRARAANDAPLELLSLSEAREADRVVLRGVVRNPASGAAIDRVAAVVMLIGQNGAVLSRARAPVAPALGPGAESAFEVAAPGAAGVERYRISFEAGDRTVSHVDERDAGARGRDGRAGGEN